MIITRILFLITLSMGVILPTHAEETDQFTLPRQELRDIGPITSYKLYELLEKVRVQTNEEIQMYLARAKYSKHAAKELALRYDEIYLADLIYKNTGPGFPRWLRHLPKDPLPMLYKETLPWNTIYWLVFSQSPLFVIGLAPTIKMYDYYFGTDKLGHFFMQGHTYYKLYRFFRDHGKSATQAQAAIVMYGQILEQTYLGTLINGVYSNADLAANYAGWKFYMNLAQSVKIGNKTLSPIFILNGGKWEFARHINKVDLLKPYLSDVLNEALNPCRYTFMRGQIRRQILKRCPDWIKRKGLTRQIVQAKLQDSTRWHGEAYGHWLPKNNAVTLDTCFGGD
jgi:hypothetical protein